MLLSLLDLFLLCFILFHYGVQYFIILVTLIIGVLIAVAAFFLIVIVPYVIGLLLGYFVGNLLYTVVLVWFPTANITLVYCLTIGICIIVAILIIKLIEDFLNATTTSVIGAYLTVRVYIIINNINKY